MNRNFYLGMIAMILWHCSFQDLIGKDRYIEMVDSGWIDSTITLPIQAVALFFVYLLAGKENGRNNE